MARHRKLMPIGRKSILFGSHHFILHPLMVAIGWRVKYGWWPKGWRTWIAIFLHDIGYWWCDDMDGESGKWHPLWASRKLAAWFAPHWGRSKVDDDYNTFWFWFAACHSRTIADVYGEEPSPMMVPDKLATALLPRWLYCALVWMSGEYVEYIAYARSKGYDVPSTAWGYSGWILNHWRSQFDEPSARPRSRA